MMKRTIKSFGSILLALCLLAALLPCAAFAAQDDYEESRVMGSVGSYCDWTWSTLDGEYINSAYVEDGMTPYGINLSQPVGGQIELQGEPAEAGTYNATVRVETDDHIYHISYTFLIDGGGVYCDSSLWATAGSALDGWSWGTPDSENISNLYVSSGSLPNGLYMPTPGSNAFSIEGTPTTAGSGSFVVCVQTFDHTYYVTISYTVASAQFQVTKSPTTENANEGSNATFIATATGYSYCDWLLISGGVTVGTYRSECNTTYGACTVIVYKNSGKEYLVLRNIPASMNGFTVKARFTNSSGTAIETQACNLYVQSTATPAPTATPVPTATPAPDMKAPSITLQPTAVTQTVGNNAVLTVAASDPNGGTLSYQWYSNTVASSTGATAINGANQSAFSAPQTIGTIYYYCSVTSTKDGKTSPSTTTTPVAVTFSDPNASPSPSVSPTASPSSDKQSSGHSSGLTILLIVLVILVAACLVCQIIYISKRNKGDAVPMVKWNCPECGTKNKAGARFCSECGAKNPKLRVRTKN